MYIQLTHGNFNVHRLHDEYSFCHRYIFLALCHLFCPHVLGSSFMEVTQLSQIVPSLNRLQCSFPLRLA